MKRSHNEDGVVAFGKHAGKTFEYVMKNHQGYCDWVLKQDDSKSEKIRDFQSYLLEHKGLLVESRTNIFTIAWTPRHHYLFPACFRKSVRVFLLCLNRLGLWLPKDILSLVIAKAVDKDGHDYNLGFGKQRDRSYRQVTKKFAKWLLTRDRDELYARSMLNFYDYCAKQNVDDTFLSSEDEYYL